MTSSARAGTASHAPEGRDADRFDAACDHLLVFDTALPGPEHHRIVGTYRLLRQEVAGELPAASIPTTSSS